jgi:hypothetical protein
MSCSSFALLARELEDSITRLKMLKLMNRIHSGGM